MTEDEKAIRDVGLAFDRVLFQLIDAANKLLALNEACSMSYGEGTDDAFCLINQTIGQVNYDKSYTLLILKGELDKLTVEGSEVTHLPADVRAKLGAQYVAQEVARKAQFLARLKEASNIITRGNKQ